MLAFFNANFLIADIVGTGELKFRADSNDSVLMTLSSNGLGIGIRPSANLHVKGSLAYNYQLVSGNSSLSGNTWSSTRRKQK